MSARSSSKRFFHIAAALILGITCFLGSAGAKASSAISDITSNVLYVDSTNGWVEYHTEHHEVLRFPAVLPAHQFDLPVTGSVVRTDYQPTWRPTDGTQDAYLRNYGIKLPDAIPYGNPQNAMGEGRIVMSFDQWWMNQNDNQYIRIHGNANEEDLHQRLSRGCFRLLDEDIITLMNAIGDRQPALIIHG